MHKSLIDQNFHTIKNILLLIFILVLAFGCSTQNSTAKVKMKIDNKTAHVTLGSSSVQIGDKVNLYKQKCEGYSGIINLSGAETPKCDLKLVGTGTVSRLFNEKYSEIKTDGSFKIEKGILVQKQEIYSE